MADGARLRVLDTPGKERPFLLVHGLASNARLWDGVGRVLAEAGHRVVAVDQRGHGESDQPEGVYGTSGAAADLSVLAEKLDLDGAVVAGQSWGGNVVVELAATYPGVASALALVDGGWIDLPHEFSSWRECERMLTPPPLDGVRAEDLERRMRQAHPDWADWAIEATAANLRVEDGFVRRRLTIPHHMQIVRSMWEHPPQRFFGDVTVPVLLVPAYGTQHAEMKQDRV
jgi:pimeloyl-ACP methyl ester carboxylesterase